MSAAEVAEWIAYERVNGPMLAHERLEVMFAALCSLLARANGHDTSPEDFLPFREKPAQTPEAMIATLESILGGK